MGDPTRVGEKIKIVASADGLNNNTGVVVKCILRDDTNTQIGSTLTLTHVGEGVFKDYSVTMPNTSMVTAKIQFFKADGTTPHDTYDNPADSFIRSDFDALIAAQLTVAASSTSTSVRTNATQANSFYNAMFLVVINSAGRVCRKITAYSNTNGAFTPDSAFPFTPANGDRAFVLNMEMDLSSLPTAAQISTQVWSEPVAGSFGAGTAGKKLGDTAGTVATNLDVAVSTRNATTPPTAAAISTAVWSEPVAGAFSAGSAGKKLSDTAGTVATNLDAQVSSRPSAAAVSTAVWTEPIAGSFAAGSAGKKLGDAAGAIATNLDATITSRASQTSVNSLPSAAIIAAAVWDLSKSGHSTAGTFGEASQGVLSTTRATNLDFLDASILSRASQASVDAIQNNTDFVGIVPSPMILPASGTKPYDIYAYLKDTSGNPEDPDSNTINITIKNTSGSTLVSSTAMTRLAAGQYKYTYTVNSSDTEQALTVFFDYAEGAVNFQQARTTEVQEFESKLDVLISRLTSTRASNLDFLDAAISSRESESSAASRASADQSSHTTTQGLITALAVPPTAAAIASAVWDSSRASHVAVGSFGEVVDAKISSREAESDAATRAAADQSEHATTQSGIGSIVTALGALASSIAGLPTAGQIADAVWDEQLSGHQASGSAGLALSTPSINQQDIIDALDTQGYTAPRAIKLDELDASIASTSNAILAAISAIPVVTPPTAAQIADAVWDEDADDHVISGSFGDAIDQILGLTSAITVDYAAISNAVWSEALPGSFATNTAGERLANVKATLLMLQQSLNLSSVVGVVSDDELTGTVDAIQILTGTVED